MESIETRTEVAERPAWCCAGYGRRDRTAGGNPQTAAPHDIRLPILDEEMHGQTSPTGASASLRQVSAAGQKHSKLDRERLLVHDSGQARGEAARCRGHLLWHPQTGALARKTPEQESRA